MRGFKFAAPLGIAALCLAATAFAKVSFLTLQNNEPKPVSVDWRLSTVPSCDTFQKQGTVTIGAKTVEKFEILNEKMLCLKLHGSTMAWRKEPLKQDSDTLVVVN
jgi:hypothetical protein